MSTLSSSDYQYIDRVVEYLRERFVGPDGLLAREEKDGEFSMIHCPLLDHDIKTHIQGDHTIGVYPASQAGTVRWFGLEVGDTLKPATSHDDAARIVRRVRTVSAEFGFRTAVLCKSPVQYRMYALLDGDVPAYAACTIAGAIASEANAGLPEAMVKAIPGRGQCGNGVTKAVPLPFAWCGTSQRSHFTDQYLNSAGRFGEPQFRHLLSLPVTSADTIRQHPLLTSSQPLITGAAHSHAPAGPSESVSATGSLEHILDLLNNNGPIRALYAADRASYDQPFPPSEEAELELAKLLLCEHVALADVVAIMNTASIGKWNGAGEQYRHTILQRAQRWCNEQRQSQRQSTHDCP